MNIADLEARIKQLEFELYCNTVQPGEETEMHRVVFKCLCGNINDVILNLNHGDNLDYHCPKCGKYYKKYIRIEDTQLISCEPTDKDR